MNCAYPHRRQHCRDCLGTRWHIDGEAVALIHAQCPKPCRDALNFGRQLAVRELASLPEFVDVYQGCTVAPAAYDVVVKAVVRKVGLGTDKPPKARVVSFENVVPLPEPRQLVGRSGPELLRCPPGILDPLLDSRIDRCHRIHPLHSFVVLAGNVVQNRIDG